MKLRSRFDLEVYPQVRRSQKVWVIKDPVSLRYFQFRDEEYAILNWLDGRSSLDQIKDRFERRFAPRRMTTTRLHTFISNLHRNGLVISDAPGQAEPLLDRYHQQQRASWLTSFANPLAIRFRGVDPEPFLRRVYPNIRWVFSKFSFILCMMLVGVALALVIGQYETFRSRLPEMNALLSPGNWIWLAIALAMTKLVHELGHAFACKHYGGECHEMGIMLLVFTPCLYCNVTDAWKLSNRFERVAISAAGIIIEVVLASVCVILWWFSQPGLFNTLCFNVMLVCSIGTVLLNGNPLLRYDGYYILSDVLDLPNLWQDARGRLNRLATWFVTGIDSGRPVSANGHPAFLLLYAMASMVYRVIVMVSILYLVYRVCKPAGFGIVAQILTALLLIGVCSAPLKAMTQIMTNPVLRRKVKLDRVFYSAGMAALILAGCFVIPLPCRIAAPAMIQPHNARRVYVSVPGTLTDAVASGEKVTSGQPLARLENIDVERELESIRGQLLKQQLRIHNLESLRNQDDAIAAQLPAAKEILADLQQRLNQLQQDQAALTLVSPIEGTVLTPPSVASSDADPSQLTAWSGTPLDESNRGALLERKTLFCLVGEKDSYEAAVFIEQSDLQYIEKDQRVRLLLDVGHGEVVTGTIKEISRANLQTVPLEMGFDQQLANRVDEFGVRRPQETRFKAIVKLDPTDLPMQIGARGQAKILVRGQPVSRRVYRFVSRTFKSVI